MWRECMKGSGVRRLAVACCVGIVTSAVACGSGSEPSAPSVSSTNAASVTITPSTMNLAVGARLPLQAQVQDASGQPVRDATVFWSSSDTTIATVSSAGVVSAKAVGAVQIAASVGLKSAVATLDVVPVPVASVTVLPGNGTIPVGGTLALSAVTYDTVRAVLTGRQVLWATSAPEVARVDAGGVVSGITVGAATITATSEGRSGASAITITAAGTTPVTPPPTTQPPVTPPPVASITLVPGSGTLTVGQGTQAVATLKDAQGNVLSGRNISYNSSNPAVATVSSSGFVTAVMTGTASITAASEGKNASATVTVTAPAPAPPAAVATVMLSLNSSSLSIGQTTQANATLKDAQGNVLSGRVIAYSSSNTSVATISGSGLVTAAAPGTATITATSEGRSGTASVTVPTPPPPAVGSVTVSPSSGTILVGGTLTFAAITKDGSGAPLSGRTIVWSSSAPQIASVGSSSGVVTAIAAGSATITATSEGKAGNAQITVTVPPVATVSVSPDTGSLQIGDTLTLSATPRDASGAALPGRVIAWSSNLPQVATVDRTTGVVTGVAGGRATITATSEGKTGSASITVQAPAPVARVVVTPGTVVAHENDSFGLTADVSDAYGNPLTGRTITWTSSSNSIAMVTATGRTATVTTKRRPGTSTITATSEGQQGISIIFVIQ